MRTFYLFIFLTAISVSSFAGNIPHSKKPSEQWVVAGLRGTFYYSFLFNANQFNDKGFKYKLSNGGEGGIMVGFHYTNWGSVNLEGLFAKYSQSQKLFFNTPNYSNTANVKTYLTYIEYPVLLHFDFENYKYAELGVKFCTLQGAVQTYESSPYENTDYVKKSVKENFNKGIACAVLGWGTPLYGSGGLLISIGFRFSYAFSDIISQTGGRGQEYLPIEGGLNTNPVPYAKTNIFTAGVRLSADFDLGSIMTSNCKRSTKFILFSH